MTPHRSPAPLAREIPDPRLRKGMHFHPARLSPSRTFNIAPARDENSEMTTGRDGGEKTSLSFPSAAWERVPRSAASHSDSVADS